MVKINKKQHVTKQGVVKRNPPKKKSKIVQQLEALYKSTDSALKKTVIVDILDNDGYEKGYMEDIMNHGCVSGSCSGLIYYTDTIAFYKKYEDEIEDLLQENKESIYGDDMTRAEFIQTLNGSKDDIQQERNLLAWFAYEETIRNIYEQDLGLEW